MYCSSCLRPIESESDLKRCLCFKCHVKNVRLGFTYGIETFHGQTIRERQREIEDSKDFKEGKIEKLSARKELI